MQDPGNTLEAAVVALQRLGDEPLDVDPPVLQRLLAAAVTAYAARRAAGDQFSPFPVAARHTPGADGHADAQATAPDASSVCLTVSAMLDAVSVEVFELAMWQAWAGATDS
jgi:hypothetical protein